MIRPLWCCCCSGDVLCAVFLGPLGGKGSHTLAACGASQKCQVDKNAGIQLLGTRKLVPMSQTPHRSSKRTRSLVSSEWRFPKRLHFRFIARDHRLSNGQEVLPLDRSTEFPEYDRKIEIRFLLLRRLLFLYFPFKSFGVAFYSTDRLCS